MDAGNYQLMAMAGIALAGYLVNRHIENKRREFVNGFVERVNEVYIPRLKRAEEQVTQLSRKANNSLDLIMGDN